MDVQIKVNKQQTRTHAAQRETLLLTLLIGELQQTQN